MVITRETSAPGTALLLAAAPAGKGRLVDAASVLPSLAAVPAEVLTGAGSTAATVVELADPLDPQTVLTRIRAAAAAPGPLFLYLAGQLHLDRKQRRLHFALARSTPTTLRYTALPWHWLAAELGPRPPGSTTLVVDLVADGDAWRQLEEGGAGLGSSVLLYGRAVPATGRRNLAQPAYLRAMAEIWRSGARPPLAELHEAALARAERVEGELLFPLRGSSAPTPTPYVPAPAPVAAQPLRPAAPAAPGNAPLPAPHPPARPTAPDAPSPDPSPAPGHTSVPAPVAPAAPGVPSPATPAPPVPAPSTSGSRATSRAGATSAEPHPAATRPAPAPATPPVPTTPVPTGPVREVIAAAGRPVHGVPSPAAGTDPHAAILDAARAGRHTEAAAAAAACEGEALRTHGPASAQALHWLEVRADLARLAGDPARSCELWMAVADSRLRRQQTTDDPDVEGAVDRAHHQWEQVRDMARARRLAPPLVQLRRRVPGRQRGALKLLQHRLEQLQHHR
ncbi:hypothetical protein ACFU9F_08650 [Streptomyces zhihengii]|uniref:hypothetical protein n=1 Tax=Streptomyces zhihengii TaxID=1818004 RepID=UPI0036949F8A